MFANCLSRRKAISVAAAGFAVVPFCLPVCASELSHFRIVTGRTAGTLFPVGSLIANVISSPPGARTCDEDGGSCGVPGLVAAAQSSEGAVENVLAVSTGVVESGLIQADIVHWAYRGDEVFADTGPHRNLRLIGHLFPKLIQIVVRTDSGISSIPEMAGKRVSLDVEGSGTLIDSRIILDSYNMSEADLEHRPAHLDEAVSMLRNGDLDGLFIVASYPTNAVFDLIDEGIATLIAVPAEDTLGLMKNHPFFSLSVIPEGIYPGLQHTSTLAIGVQWIVTDTVPDDLVYGITRALWHENSRPILDSGHPSARQLKLSNAVLGATVPLHPGARAYYAEAGLDLSHVPMPADTTGPI